MRSTFLEFKPLAQATVVLLSPFLTDCSQDSRAADVKQCIAKAQDEAAHEQLPYLLATDSAEVRHDKIGSEIAECMAMVGYHHDSASMVDERCVDDVDFNPYCYKRATWMHRLHGLIGSTVCAETSPFGRTSKSQQ